MINTNDTRELITLPEGTKVLWCGKPNTILRSKFGRVLVRDDRPRGQWTEVFSGYGVWSSGGGYCPSRTRINSEETAIAFFEDDCTKAKTFWDKVLADPNTMIIKGESYHDGGWSNAASHLLGFSGNKWTIQDKATKETWSTNNLWHQGVVPKDYNKQNTHEFLKYNDFYPKSKPPMKQPSLSQEQMRIVES